MNVEQRTVVAQHVALHLDLARSGAELLYGGFGEPKPASCCLEVSSRGFGRVHGSLLCWTVCAGLASSVPVATWLAASGEPTAILPRREAAWSAFAAVFEHRPQDVKTVLTFGDDV